MTPPKRSPPAGRRALLPDDPVDRLVGIGPKTAAALSAHGVRTVADLLFHLPRRYEDRGTIVTVEEARRRRGRVLMHGRLIVRTGRYVRRRLHIADGELADETGRIPVRWFNQPWVQGRLETGPEAFVFGVVGEDRSGRLNLVNPEIEIGPKNRSVDEFTPVYGQLGPLSGKRLRKVVDQALGCACELVDPLPETARREFGLIPLARAVTDLHRPRAPEGVEDRGCAAASLNARASHAHERLAFDELLATASVVADHRARRLEQSAVPVRVPPGIHGRARDLFGFELTGAQKRVVSEILRDLGRRVPMARLLQGDVGCGKTAVAALAIFAVVGDRRQTALMAPTELLAEQIHRSIVDALGSSGFKIRLLTGSTASAEGRSIRSGLEKGTVDVVVGTHALFQEGVRYRDLALVVIDEQHRFGVAQRQRLLDKGEAPHLLVMTATPIPRSLALTVYGDLDLSVIDELPPGRRPIRTEVRGIEAREKIYRFLRSEIDAGGQCYIVYPLIEASESLGAAALGDHEMEVRRALGGREVGVLHARLDRADRELVAARFRQGELKAILATTVIEVGVDVPAATVMVIEGADRFGLSQLHQLRGRVGRGARRSWCILVTGNEPSADAERRLRVLQESTDGFAIAEADLRHRGPGELTGRRQWGAESLRFADLVRHRELVDRTRSLARRLAERGELDDVAEVLLRYHPVGAEFAIG